MQEFDSREEAKTRRSGENAISTPIVDAAIATPRLLGPGLLESVYERVLAHQLKLRGLAVQRQVPVSIQVEDLHFDEGFRADLIVEDLIILELKAVEELAKVHHRQLFTYLKLSGMRLGFLFNFGSVLMKHGIVRVVNQLEDPPFASSRLRVRNPNE